MALNPANLTGNVLPVDTAGSASTALLITGGALVFIMTPGLGLFYSGMARAKNSLSLVMLSYLAMCVTTFQWFIWGFSLAFSQNGSPVIGDWSYMGFYQVNQFALPLTAPSVSALAFAFYQLMFAAVTPAIIFGAVAERVRMLPSMIFIFVWDTLVYDFTAYWTWAPRGWLRNLSCLSLSTDPNAIPCQIGAYDFAGGGPVHMASGFSGLAFCIFLGARRNVDKHVPHNLIHMFIGTALLWFGWILFNSGSEGAANARAAAAAWNTTFAAAMAGLTWVLFDFVFLRKLSGLSLCSGAIAGLVLITPASGFVPTWAALVIGIVGGFITNLACRMKPIFAYDDTLDVFGIHGVGGFVGVVMTGIFASSSIANISGSGLPGGAIDGRGILVGYQFAAAVTISAWSFLVTFIILWLMSRIPGLHFRSSKEQELYGDDLGEMGEINMEAMRVERPDGDDADAALPAAPRIRGFGAGKDTSGEISATSEAPVHKGSGQGPDGALVEL